MGNGVRSGNERRIVMGSEEGRREGEKGRGEGKEREGVGVRRWNVKKNLRVYIIVYL